MRRVVVTGATGFIGRRLIEHLLRDGLDGERVHVVAIARHPASLGGEVRDAIESHALDLAEAPAEAISAACGRDAVVFHLAANASVNGGDAGYHNNVQSTTRLLDALRHCAPRRVVYASSIGAVDRAPSDPCTALLDEQAAPHPLTRYGEGKLEGERLVAASGLRYTILRPTWVYGPQMRVDSHLRVFLAMTRAGALASRLNFPGRVSLIHVDDLCAALMRSATADAAAGQTYFVTDGAPVAIGTLFREMGDIVGRRAGTLSLPGVVVSVLRAARRALPLSVQCLASDVLAASGERLESLGFQPSVSRRRGLIALARETAPVGGRWIVTGAASGIGRALAVQLYAAGHEVAAVDVDADGLQALAQDCPQMETVQANLATTEGRTRVAEVVGDHALAGFVNCAGIGARGIVADVTDAAQARLLGINVVALAELSALAIRRLSAQPSGGVLVNVASSAALQPLPGMAAYAASKSFVLSFSEAAAEELSETPVRVITVCPGGTDTNFQTASGVKRVEGERLMPAAEVARQTLAAIQRGRSTTVLIGGRTQVMGLLARLLPRRQLVRLWGRLMRAMR
jgi:nucleoside-diphosphate-sugar epimerase